MISFRKLDPSAIIPTRATPHSAGLDLYALEDTLVGATTVIVPTGVAVRLPPGTYGRIAMRSGLAVRHSLAVSAGVIDIDYEGAIGVVTHSTDGSNYTIKKGDRFAQLIVEKCCYGNAIEVEEFPKEFDSQHLGYGSSGR